jgi:hypothetical protein
MLAAFDFASYSTAVHKLEAGDRIVMYTDGILEASNPAGDFFGHNALCDLARPESYRRDGSRLDYLFGAKLVSKTGRRLNRARLRLHARVNAKKPLELLR